MNQLPPYNLLWMIYNILLAIVPVLLGWTLFSTKPRFKLIRFLLGFLWLIFFPNALYLFADITHLFEEWPKIVDINSQVILILQFSLILLAGFLTHIYALYPIEEALKKQEKIKNPTTRTNILITINFLVGFGVTLGRVHRVNSWDLVTNLPRIWQTTTQLLSTPNLIAVALLLGLFANFLYFLFRKPVLRYLSHPFH